MAQQGWVSWTQTSWQQTGWFKTFQGNNTAVFGNPSPFSAVTSQPANNTDKLGLTDGAGQAAAVIISKDGQAFQTQALCPSNPGSFSFTYAFSISPAQPAPSWNSLSDGLTLAFIDSSRTPASGVQWSPDVSDVLVPTPAAVILEIDTHDDACGSTPSQPCTGSYTSYDNQNIPGAGAGYRLASPMVREVVGPANNLKPLADYVSNNLMYGGTYSSTTNGTSIAVVAATGAPVVAQVDFTATGPGGKGVLSWTINGALVFGAQPVTMPASFWIGFAASTGSNMEAASLVLSQKYNMSLFCPLLPPPPLPPSPPVIVTARLANPSCSPEMETGNFLYVVCLPNGVITQQGPLTFWGLNKGTLYTLGRNVWWNNALGIYQFNGGDSCGSSLSRSGKITVFCGGSQSVNVFEPTTCYYDIRYWTPAACASPSPPPALPPPLPPPLPPQPPLPPVVNRTLPISNLAAPIYGPCSAVQSQLQGVMLPGTPALTSGGWAGPVQCSGFPTVYSVGDAFDAGASVQCYTYTGQACTPGAAGCPCVYPTATPSYASPFGGKRAAAGQPGGGWCLVCPAETTTASTARVTAPVYGNCTQLTAKMQFTSVAAGSIVAGQEWSGQISCAGFPDNKYWVGDFNDYGKSLACYDAFGTHCVPGAVGCPCKYPSVPPYDGQTTYATYSKPGAGMCLICPATPRPPMPPSPPNPPPPWPPLPSTSTWTPWQMGCSQGQQACVWGSSLAYASNPNSGCAGVATDIVISDTETFVLAVGNEIPPGGTNKMQGNFEINLLKYVSGQPIVVAKVTDQSSSQKMTVSQTGTYILSATCYSSISCTAQAYFITIPRPTWA
jgi:hypothetical protein